MEWKLAKFPAISMHFSADVTFQRMEQNENFSQKAESIQ